HGTHLAELRTRRSARHRHDDLSVRLTPPDARAGSIQDPRNRAAVSRRAVPASGRRSVRRGARHGNTYVRGSGTELRQDAATRAMKIYSQDNSELMRIDSIERDGSQLLIK